MTDILRIGLAGLGTVGGGVIKLLAENEALITRRAGRPDRRHRHFSAGPVARPRR